MKYPSRTKNESCMWREIEDYTCYSHPVKRDTDLETQSVEVLKLGAASLKMCVCVYWLQKAASTSSCARYFILLGVLLSSVFSHVFSFGIVNCIKREIKTREDHKSQGIWIFPCFRQHIVITPDDHC